MDNPFNMFSYQPSADGLQFLVSMTVAGSKPPITVVLNWQSDFGTTVIGGLEPATVMLTRNCKPSDEG